ncbi:MAG: hypothetical protein K0B15_01005 [Lentimicrobium sp.]|nr:hypothetical protein [Lentimicrobium sp.]
MEKRFNPTQEQIDVWKKQHGDLFMVTVEDKSCILKKPSLKVISMATTVGANDPIKFSEMMLTNCWVAGDEEIKTNDELFLGVAGKLAELVEVKEAELKKL